MGAGLPEWQPLQAPFEAVPGMVVVTPPLVTETWAGRAMDALVKKLPAA